MSSNPEPTEVPARLERRLIGHEWQASSGRRYALLSGVRLLVNLRAHGSNGVSMPFGECDIDTGAAVSTFGFDDWHGVLDAPADGFIEWLSCVGRRDSEANASEGQASQLSRFGIIRVSLYGTPPDDGSAFSESQPFDMIAEFLPRKASSGRTRLAIPGNALPSWEQMRLDVNNHVAWLVRSSG